MGVVYEAFDRDRSVTVALKTLRHLGPDALLRFKTEFRSLQDLQHDNVVSLGELSEVGGDWFFTMELVPGCDWLSFVRPNDDTYREDRLRDAMIQLASGLDAIHRAGLVHRDLKPSNIRVSPQGRLVILDFGLVADLSAAHESNTVVGTAAYMAPEQAASKPATAAADWYSAGILLYEALTGVLPFQGTMLEVLLAKQDPSPLSPVAVAPGLPADLATLCERMLAFAPADRPDGAGVLAQLGATPAPALARGSVASTTAPFVGRDKELASLHAAFEQVVAGRTVTVEVRGQSGVGKSALLRRFTQRLAGAETELVVLRGRCYEREAVPYKAFDGIVDSLAGYLRRLPRQHARALMPDDAALLPQVFPVLGRVEAIAAAPRQAGRIDDPHELRARVFEAVRSLLAALSQRQPLVVVIDDMQWTDADSLLLLADIVRPPDAPAMLLLLSSRAARTRKSPLTGDVRQIELDALTSRDARKLAQQLLARSGIAVADPAQLADEAGGHPLFLHELVRHATLGDETMPRAARLDDAVWSRVTQLDVDARRVLELVCIAGAPLPEEAFAAAAEVDSAQFARHMAVLRTAQLIAGRGQPGHEIIEPYHDRIRETVGERLDEASRRARHQRLVLALEVAGLSETRPEVALLHAMAVDDRERASRYAIDAAKRASNGLAFDRAAELWRTALDLGGHDRERQRRLRIALGNALTARGHGHEAAESFLAAAVGADATTRRACRRKAAEQLLSTGYIERGLDVLEQLLRELGTPLPPTAQRALVSLAWHRMKLKLRGLRWTRREAEDVPEDQLVRVDAYHTVSHGLGVVDSIRGMDFQARGLLAALRTGEPVRVAVALLQEAGFRATAGGRSIARAQPLVAEARRIADTADDAFLTAWRVGIDAVVNYFGGEFETARNLMADAERMLRAIPDARWELSSSRLFMVLILKQLGAIRRMSLLSDRWLRDAERRGDLFTGTSLRVLSAWRWLANDDPAGARRDLDETTWTPPEGGFHLQHFWKLESRCEIALYEGAEPAQLAALDAEWQRYSSSMLTRIQLIRCAELSVRGRMAVATARAGHEPKRQLKRAARFARKLGREAGVFPHAWAGALRAAISAQHGDHDRAIRLLREACDIAQRHEQAWWLAALRYRLGAMTGDDEGKQLLDRARRWMTGEGVARPQRMAEVLAPGFDD